jgi:putative ABC transport system permease protein
MTWMNRIRSVFRRRRFESDLDEELQFHIETKMQENIAAGMAPEQARSAAKRAFGNTVLVRESARGAWGFGSAERLWQDTRYAFRAFRKNPGFTALILVTLAFGIGANTAIFSVVYGVLMKPLTFDDPGRLVKIYQSNPKTGARRMQNSAMDIEDARAQNRSFEGIATFHQLSTTLTGRGEPEQVGVCSASSDLFGVLRAQPILGRTFSTQEQKSGEQVALISRALWERSMAGDPSALGQSITLDQKSYTVIGVMPGSFRFPDRGVRPIPTEIWLPIAGGKPVSRGGRSTEAIARLKPGVTLAQARQDMDAISAALAQAYKPDEDFKFVEAPLLEDIVGDARPAVMVIFAAVAFVLLIACANVANLLLARGASRQKEIAIRSAIGASRARIVKQLLTESVILGLGGGVLGIAIAIWGVGVLAHLAPKDFPRLDQVRLTPWVLAFNLSVSVAVGVLFGILPAVQVSKTSLLTGLKDGSVATPTRSASIRRRTYANLLVISQIAMSIVLLTGAGLMSRSFLRLTSVDLGFDPTDLTTFQLALPLERYKAAAPRVEFYQQSLERIRSLPGVEYASVSSSCPLSGGFVATDFIIAGAPAPGPDAESPEAGYNAITSDYFHCMGIPILKGRSLDDQDRAGKPPVVVVNQAFVHRYLGGGDALGQRIKVDWGDALWSEIVGVVGDTRDVTPGSEPAPQIYAPLFQSTSPLATFLVRTGSLASQSNLVFNLRSVIASVDQDEPISDVVTMHEAFSDRVAQPRFQMALITAFSLLALTLTAVGLYGVVSYSVAERTHEIGVRMSLGANCRSVLILVMSRVILLAFAGVAIGVGAAHWLTRLIATMLYSVKPTDTLTFVGVSLLLIIVALVASYLPARRATKLDPLTALRYE